MKSTLILPILALASRVLAQPPACLLNAVNSQQDPSNLSAVCGKEATSVQSAIASLCKSNASAAQSAFIATCSGAGTSVAPYTAKSTTQASSGTFVYTTAVYNSDCSCTTTIVTSATGAAAASSFALATATKSGSGSSASATGAKSTGNIAVAHDIRLGSFAAAAVAVAGVVAAL